MSGTVPGAPWGNTLNQVRMPRYVIKRRERMQWTTHTIKGPRRVGRWGPWREVDRRSTKWEAAQRAEELGRVGLSEYAVFFGGRISWRKGDPFPPNLSDMEAKP